MPIITDKRKIAAIREVQQNCFNCQQSPGRNERSSAIICDLCSHWLCKDCANIDNTVYDLVVQNDISYNHICTACREEIPKIKDLILISQKQIQMEEDITAMKKDIETNKQSLQKVSNFETRLRAVEQVIQTNKLDDANYPLLPDIDATTRKLQEKLFSQKEKTSKLNTNFEEDKRKAAKTQNLIVYGLPELHTETIDQMKADFNVLRELYAERVQLATTDISSITRLGQKKDGKIRPIRITFVEPLKRREILINNKGLKIEGQNHDLCECKNPGHHIHINITNDKTQQEREIENKLREELKQRRIDGEDVIIKKGKIIKRTSNEAYPRWAEVCKNGYH